MTLATLIQQHCVDIGAVVNDCQSNSQQYYRPVGVVSSATDTRLCTARLYVAATMASMLSRSAGVISEL